MHRNDTCSVMLIYMQKWCLMLNNTVKHPMNGQWIAYAYICVCCVYVWHFLVCLYARKTEKEIEKNRERDRESDKLPFMLVESIYRHTHTRTHECFRVDQFLFRSNFYTFPK